MKELAYTIQDSGKIYARPAGGLAKLQGKSVCGGIAIGRLSVYKKKDNGVKRERIPDADAEIKRFEDAKETARNQLADLHDKAMKEIGESAAAILEAHQLMLDDMDYCESIVNMIQTQEVSAEYAVAMTGDYFADHFAAMDDEYMKARSADVKDISNRVIAVLQGVKDTGIHSDEPVILLAEDLAPSESVQLDRSKLLSFVTGCGSANSHTAILARSMNIPALIGVDYSEDMDGHFGIVDGFAGALFVDPDEETAARYRKKQDEEKEKARLLQELRDKPDVTKDGKEIRLYANIGGVGDMPAVMENDASGIGLFRTEFLYLESETIPTEEEQFCAYRSVIQAMADKKVIIRTLDLGADKQVDDFNPEHEDNPAMGYRAIRICLEKTDIFKTQLRAIFRAACFGNVGIMFPMIISVDEVRRAKAIVEEVKAELLQEHISFGEVELGIMIETPAAVWISEELAEEVDFFSIGTNDLTQYMLAIDRQNPRLDAFYDVHHPAVLRAIEMTIKNGHKGGAWVGICGELGADTTLTEKFLRMDVDELSVSPSSILAVRSAIRNCDLSVAFREHATDSAAGRGENM